MDAIPSEQTVQDARSAARLSLSQQPLIQLSYSLTRCGMYVVTSPEADWLMVTGYTQTAARMTAMVAFQRVSIWCGVGVRLPPAD
ncbi:hypothetical protein EV668_1066 [Enterovirga rhinocerotis]|uniref:Uncharacterized protein n=1 Tax=Enterovirga rhinocerotis TaxID=1339210 RepID=A0A4V3DYS7_9HYPH|nr:hypothetical protein EV668_1066 [Enterovirga rhinocerotis]